MFRSNFVNRTKNTIKFLRSMSLSENAPSLKRSAPARENLSVRLCGQIVGKTIKTRTGAIVFPMKIKNKDEESEHQIFVRPSLLVNHFTTGNRAYVTGRIGYTEITSDEGRPVHIAQIQSHTIFLCAKDKDSSNDINEVKLYGIVKNEPHIDANVTSLVVATEYFDAKDQCYKSNLHDVVMTENDEIQQQANCVHAGASVLIHGFLKSERIHNQNGNSLLTCYIRPTKLIVNEPTKNNYELDFY